MVNKMVYVILDRDGNYIAPGNFINTRQTEQGWYFFKFTGDSTGFVFYTSKKTAEFELNALRGLGYDFVLEYVDFNLIPKGKRIKNNCLYKKKDNTY